MFLCGCASNGQDLPKASSRAIFKWKDLIEPPKLLSQYVPMNEMWRKLNDNMLLPSCCQGDIRSGYTSWAYHLILQNLPTRLTSAPKPVQYGRFPARGGDCGITELILWIKFVCVTFRWLCSKERLHLCRCFILGKLLFWKDSHGLRKLQLFYWESQYYETAEIEVTLGTHYDRCKVGSFMASAIIHNSIVIK